jgi:ferredoxin
VTDDRWVVTIDKGICAGTGLCAGLSPDLFQVVGGTAELLGDSVVEPHDDYLVAAEGCPIEAIRVVNRETGEVLAPEV